MFTGASRMLGAPLYRAFWEKKCRVLTQSSPSKWMNSYSKNKRMGQGRIGAALYVSSGFMLRRNSSQFSRIFDVTTDAENGTAKPA